MELTHILVVSDLQRSVLWYRDVLGAALTGEYGGTSAVFNYGPQHYHSGPRLPRGV